MAALLGPTAAPTTGRTPPALLVERPGVGGAIVAALAAPFTVYGGCGSRERPTVSPVAADALYRNCFGNCGVGTGTVNGPRWVG